MADPGSEALEGIPFVAYQLEAGFRAVGVLAEAPQDTDEGRPAPEAEVQQVSDQANIYACGVMIAALLSASGAFDLDDAAWAVLRRGIAKELRERWLTSSRSKRRAVSRAAEEYLDAIRMTGSGLVAPKAHVGFWYAFGPLHVSIFTVGLLANRGPIKDRAGLAELAFAHLAAPS